MATGFDALFGAGGPGGGMGMGAPQTGQGAVAPAAVPFGAAPPPEAPMAFARAVTPTDTAAVTQSAIDKLRPDSDLSMKVLNKLDAMFKFSQDEMKKHYARWNFNERKIQAYVTLADYEKLTQNFDQKGIRPPEPMSVVVPYSYATIHAAATFVSQVLLGRKPVFPLMAVRGTMVQNARYMEQALQSQLDASRGYETLWQHIWDGLVYGMAPLRISWEKREGQTIRMINGQRENVTALKFAGNVITAIDPYQFFPDPRVPIHQCNERGDFIFTQQKVSETVLRDMEKQGGMKWVKQGLAKAGSLSRDADDNDDSRRRIKLGIRGEGMLTPTNVVGFRTIREGTVRLVPKEWGLGDSDQSELWKFSWIKNAQVLQAEPLGMIHAHHPYVCSEPTSLGHDFMSLSMADMIGTFQDILSWIISSRIENVRSAINNQFVADPARVDISDIRSSPIGRIIRLKQAAMGLPVQEAIMQLAVTDVTQGHLSDAQVIRTLADSVTGVNDNLRGIQNQGGRRSATEARISIQSAGGRLSQFAIRISSQSFQPMASQMIMNNQQFMPDEMWVEVTGDDEQPSSKQLTPNMLIGDYNMQISDGTLPFDKTALVEVWKEILLGVAQDPELRQRYDIGEIFEYTAELGGAKNIESFKRQMPQMAAEPGADPKLAAFGSAMPSAPMG